MKEPSLRSVILGTAGHIDHGKSTLVKALTGIDPDRLKEEKERGITIDLGFANLAYDDGTVVGIVDVPGHEKLIRNMLAGAGGIDMVLMVIAADEGIMPQSREHLAICELLKIKAGIIAVTKADLVDEEWLQLIVDDVRSFVAGTFLEDADILPVSARTGLNLDTLKQRIRSLAEKVRPKLINGIFRLPIDRVFTLKGFGTVVTGTALSGTIHLESPVEILPSGLTTKVRGLQTHGRSVQTAYAGQRIGVNLQGIEKEALRRGDVVVSPGRFEPTRMIDVSLRMLQDAPTIKSRSLVHLYSGTAETVGRVVIYDKDEVKAGEGCFCQLRLTEPVVVEARDRFIIRRFSPLETIGGGEILDPHPIRRRRGTGTEDLAVFETGDLKAAIETKVQRSMYGGCRVSEIEGWIQGDLEDISAAIHQLLKEGKLIRSQETLFHLDAFETFRQSLRETLRAFHQGNPLKPGLSKEELKARIKGDRRSDKIFELLPLVEDVVAEREMVRLKEFRVSLSTAGEDMRNRILSVLDKEGFQPPFKAELREKLSIDEKQLNDLLKLLSKEGLVVRITDTVYLSRQQHDRMIGLLREFFAKKPEMTVAEFRDLLGTTRKYALPFLEYLDGHKMTLRIGDVRKFMLK
jgi:selenocysteine-specific elongation factor